MKYTPVIGLEVHIEPNTETKMFCGCPQDHFGKKPNTHTCPICLGLPGALPYENFEAIKKTVQLGLALGSKISSFSNFYRKHYFYPDLSKSFQTSQKDHPLCEGGELLGKKLDHIHLEEDAGKLVHETVNGEKVSLVDFNRCGCALIEIVTEPVFRSSEEVLKFTKELQLIVRYLNVGGADMEKGTMRLEANVSVTTDTGKLPDYKVELKNINSFKFLTTAIEAEIKRQTEALEKGEKLIQETRGYDEVKKTTFSQRSKEEAQDYRYFPEADLPPVELTENQIAEIKDGMPELPNLKRKKFADMGIPANYLEFLVADKKKAELYEKTFELAKKEKMEPKLIANLIVNKGLKGRGANEIVKNAQVLSSIDYAGSNETEKAVEEVLKENPKAVEEFKSGKEQVVGFLIGMVQKKLQGKADPKIIPSKLREKMS